MSRMIEIVLELTKKEIKIRYKNSYLGYLWSLANPLLTALVFYFIFQTIMRIKMENYDLFLISGLFVWQFISNNLSLGTMLFVGNAGLVKKVKFKRYLLAIAMILSEGFNFIFSIPIILGFMIYYGKVPGLIWIIGIPLLFIITSIFVCGIGLFLGTINLFFRDLERLIGIFLMFSFYATPIFYPITMVPEGYLFYIQYLNPFSSFIVIWRDLFLENTLNIQYIVIATTYAFISLFIGMYTYNKLKNKFAELI